MENKEARESLAAIADAKRTTAENSKAPAGYYSVIGLAMGLLQIGLPLQFTWRLPLLLVAMLLVIGAVVWYSQTVSTWAWASLRGHGAWLFWLMMVFPLIGFAVVVPTQSLGIAVASAAVTVVAWSVLGPLWDRAYRRQMELS